ncbi:MAG TPA: hypothetical protein VGT61_04330 [Thermomicrobiales bacterium]|nr:hypothetical protein [Thermomicrobiales bacterium]
MPHDLGPLHHISDRSGIERFVPRVAPTDPGQREVVWAVDADHLGHFLVPRDCPRVCFRAGPDSTEADIETLLGGDRSRRVVAVEQGWLERISVATLYRYDLHPETFRLHDAVAGYYISDDPVEIVATVALTDLPAELVRAGYELLALPSLWTLREQVIASSLPFSIIRWRNAAPDDRTEITP